MMMINSDCEWMWLWVHSPQKKTISPLPIHLQNNRQKTWVVGSGQKRYQRGHGHVNVSFPNTLAIEVHPCVRGQSMQNQFCISKCLSPGKLASPWLKSPCFMGKFTALQIPPVVKHGNGQFTIKIDEQIPARKLHSWDFHGISQQAKRWYQPGRCPRYWPGAEEPRCLVDNSQQNKMGISTKGARATAKNILDKG